MPLQNHPHASRSRQLTKIGLFALRLLLGLSIMVWVGHRLGLLQVWSFRHLGLFLGTGALTCLLGGWLLSRPSLQKIGLVVCTALLGLNVLAFVGAYTLTHYRQPQPFSFGSDKPYSAQKPTDIGLAYTTHKIEVNRSEWIETWLIRAHQPQGTVLLFHGNHGTKGQQLLPPANVFHDLSYNALLVDFRGAGGSSGYTSSTGYREAEDVALAVQQAQELGLEPPLVLYGISMGSAAILRAIAIKTAQPDAIILELPFVRLTQAIRSRLSLFPLPTSPMTELLVFWGGIQQGFNGFTHNPITYAKQVTVPSLILQGQQDRWTTTAEIEALQNQLRGPSQRVVFPTAGHHLLVTVDPDLWRQKIDQFLRATSHKME
jgi:uncharacterized protein